MSKVTDLAADDVIANCANEECGSEVHFGQAVHRHENSLYCCTSCMLSGVGVEVVIAGREEIGGHSTR